MVVSIIKGNETFLRWSKESRKLEIVLDFQLLLLLASKLHPGKQETLFHRCESVVNSSFVLGKNISD